MAGYLIAQVGAETIRRGPVASRAEGRRRWPFLPADAAWEGEDEAEEPQASPQAPPAPPLPPPAPPPPPPAPPTGEAPLTRGQRLWRERMARKGKL